MTESVNLKSKFLGGMVGCGVGDAIGELAFSYSELPTLRAAVGRRDILTYTDDTAMAIGLAESLAAVGKIEPQHLGETFRANYVREPWRGYAMGPPSIFERVKREGVSYTEAASALFGGEGSYGNGAAMRVAPAGLFFHDADDLYEQVRRSASVTHAHPLGIDGAALVAWAVARVVDLSPEEPLDREAFVRGLLDFARTDELRSRLEDMATSLEEESPAGVVGLWLGPGVAAHRSVPFALYAFLRYPDSFETCLFCAALHSGDRDTVGAMAAAISGAYLGVEAIPEGWRRKLEKGDYIRSLAESLYERSLEA
ncbi:MAG: ADP-ribosylglycohydrolase family protein [Anaerolineales bacterium]